MSQIIKIGLFGISFAPSEYHFFNSIENTCNKDAFQSKNPKPFWSLRLQYFIQKEFLQ